MRRSRLHVLAPLVAVLALPFAASAAPHSALRVLSFDQCADQYVMALSPRDAIVGLSSRADDADSRLRALAHGLPVRRVGLESALAARPQIVIRYWGGDPSLVQAIQARGVTVVTLSDATDFDDVRANIRAVAAALGRPAAGQALIARMDARLARAHGAWGGRRGLYLTPGGATTGPGTLVDAILRAAGMTNAQVQPGYRMVSLEQIAMNPPHGVVLGFFDTYQSAGDSWGMGRHHLLKRLVADRAAARLPGAMLGCPDWGAAEAAELLAQQAPR